MTLKIQVKIDDEALYLLVDCSRSGGYEGKKVSNSIDGLTFDGSVMGRNLRSSNKRQSARSFSGDKDRI